MRPVPRPLPEENLNFAGRHSLPNTDHASRMSRLLDGYADTSLLQMIEIEAHGTVAVISVVFPPSQEGGGATASVLSEDRHPAGMKPRRGFSWSAAEIEPCRKAAPGSLFSHDRKIRAFERSRP